VAPPDSGQHRPDSGTGRPDSGADRASNGGGRPDSGADRATWAAARWLGFLSDEQRAVLHGRSALRRVHALIQAPTGDVEDLYVAANLLALVLFRQGRVVESRQLCRDEIGYALRRRGTGGWPLLAMLALQPQINLLRIDGYGHDVDGALAGFRQFEEIGDGRGVALPEITLDTGDVDRIKRAGLPLRATIRNVTIADSCKILWRHGQLDRLLAHADRLCRRWPATPHLIQHAAEAPWLIDALTRPPLPTAELERVSDRSSRRLTYVQLLHVAAQAAGAGQVTLGRDTAVALHQRRDMLGGAYASALTPLRCLASLADTLRRLGRDDLATPLLHEVLARPETRADRVLHQGLQARLGIRADDGRPTAEEGPAYDSGQLLAELRSRLVA
jgi:hypothetical protein